MSAQRPAPFDDDKTGPAGPVLFGATAFLLVFAPLVRGGDRPPALMALELAALAILVVLALGPEPRDLTGRLSATLRWALALLLVYPLLQLFGPTAAEEGWASLGSEIRIEEDG